MIVGRFFDETQYDRDADRFAEDGEPAEVKCNRCGAEGLFWEMVTAPDGCSEKPVLFEQGMRRHVCKPSADDFEVVG